MSAAQARAALTSDRVDLVDEDDARRRLLGLIEEIAHARRTDADEHFDEVRTGDREERHAGLARDRARKQRFAGSRRPEQQHAFGNARAQRLIFLGVLQEVDDLAELLFGLVDAGDVGESHLGTVLAHHLRARAPERKRLAPAALRLAQYKEEQRRDQQQRCDTDQARDQTAIGRLLESVLTVFDMPRKLLRERAVGIRQRDRILGPAGEIAGRFESDRVERTNLVCFELLIEHAVVEALHAFSRLHQLLHNEKDDQHGGDDEDELNGGACSLILLSDPGASID